MIGLAVVLFHVIFVFLFFGVVLGFCSFRCRRVSKTLKRTEATKGQQKEQYPNMA
jgi:hypothetical protein